MTLAHVKGLTSAVLPASYDCSSIVAVESVMRRKSLRRLSRLEPPLGPACAMALRHAFNCSEPLPLDPARDEFSCLNMSPRRTVNHANSCDASISGGTAAVPRNNEPDLK